jgi:CDGSH-type Zn-finger protein
MLVTGLALGRLGHDGDDWRVESLDVPGPTFALCRCGRSSTMPLCDRAEPYRCFQEEPETGPQPAPYRWDVPDPSMPGLALKPNGPVRVAGGVAISHGDRVVAARDRISLCRCGASRCQPLCDGSHEIVGYRG